jgi:ATP dependent DNA ligase domain
VMFVKAEGRATVSSRWKILSSVLYRCHWYCELTGAGRPLNAPAAFIHPCQPIVSKEPPSGPGWAHELKHDGYRLQVHVRDGRVRLFTRNGADWSKRYPRIVEEAARIKGSAVMDDATPAIPRTQVDSQQTSDPFAWWDPVR